MFDFLPRLYFCLDYCYPFSLLLVFSHNPSYFKLYLLYYLFFLFCLFLSFVLFSLLSSFLLFYLLPLQYSFPFHVLINLRFLLSPFFYCLSFFPIFICVLQVILYSFLFPIFCLFSLLTHLISSYYLLCYIFPIFCHLYFVLFLSLSSFVLFFFFVLHFSFLFNILINLRLLLSVLFYCFSFFPIFICVLFPIFYLFHLSFFFLYYIAFPLLFLLFFTFPLSIFFPIYLYLFPSLNIYYSLLRLFSSYIRSLIHIAFCFLCYFLHNYFSIFIKTDFLTPYRPEY